MPLSIRSPPARSPKRMGRASGPLATFRPGTRRWKDLYLSSQFSPSSSPDSSAAVRGTKAIFFLGSRRLMMFLKFVQGPQSES